MEFSAELAAITGISASVFSAGVTYGIMSTRLARLERDVSDEAQKRGDLDQKFVSMQYFRAVVEPMQQQLRDVGRDIKKILSIVSHHRTEDEET